MTKLQNSSEPETSTRRRAPLLAGTAVAVCLGVTALATGPASAGEVDDLRAENVALEARLEALATDMDVLRAQVAANRVAAEEATEAAESVAAVPQSVVTSGNPDTSLSISGQVNRMVLYADDGNQSRFFHADNDKSSTRIRFQGKRKMDEEWSAGTNIEVQFESNASGDVTIDQNTSVIDNNSFTERKLEVYVASDRLGKLWLGQGDTASNGTAEVDLSGTTVISSSDIVTIANEVDFVLSGTAGTSSGDDPGDLYSNNDGLSRDDRIRYDTPSFAGFKLSTSWVDGDEWDIAARYGRDYDGFNVALGASYWDSSPTNGLTGLSMSGSVKADFGTSLTGTWSQADSDAVGRDTETFWFAKLGHQWSPFDIGSTAVSASYANTDDQEANGKGGDYMDIAFVQKINSLGTELYGMIGQFEPNVPGAQLEALTVGGAGARVKF